MINDRAWTIVACSAKEKEGMILNILEVLSLLLFIVFEKTLMNILSLTLAFIGLQEGLNWLVQNVDV
jgi:hypothetical protein